METFVPALVVASLIVSLTNLYKIAVARQFAKVALQVVTWIIGIAVAFMFRATDWASSYMIGEGEHAAALSQINNWSVVFVGISLAGVGNVVYAISPMSTPTPFERPGPDKMIGETGEISPNDYDPDPPTEPGERPSWLDEI